MRRLMLAAMVAAVSAGAMAPALAQSPGAQARWEAAQRDYQIATDRFNAERQRYYDAVRYDRRGNYPPPRGDYPPPPPPPPGGGYQPYETDYDAARYYRDGPGYQERTLSANDQVYKGSDGRMYCKRSDGTTGLIIGAAGGGILGNLIDGGRHRTAGTLLGAAVGALAGKAIDQNNSQVKCR